MSDQTRVDPLDIATTDQLINALSKRFQTFACVAMKEAMGRDAPDEHAMIWRYKGNRFMCVGMTYNLIHLLNREIEEEITTIPNGEL